MSLNIADSMFAPVALGIPASIFMVEAVWDGMIAVKKKVEGLMGLIFKDLENRWVRKGREQGREDEYNRIIEALREQGIDYTPPHRDDKNSKK